MTRPDIAYIVSKLSQFLHCPTDVHWQACKRVLRYLKGSQDIGLHIQPAKEQCLIGFSDVDWAGSLDDRRSTGGYCIYLGPNLVSWSSKKQHVVARSSTESEYRSLAHTASELTWLQSLCRELHVTLSTSPVLWCDNIGATCLASNPVAHARTKHIEIDVHFIRDKVLQGTLEVRYVPTEEQTVDIMTKPLALSRFQFHLVKLNLSTSPFRLKGRVEAHSILQQPDEG